MPFFFTSFKRTHGLSQYLLTVKNVALKRNLVRLRLGVSFLKPHRLRFSKTTQENFDCSFCEDTYESEIRFLLVCPKYSVLREKYIPAKFYTRPSAYKMALLLAARRHTRTLAIYVAKAFALRSEQNQSVFTIRVEIMLTPFKEYFDDYICVFWYFVILLQ